MVAATGEAACGRETTVVAALTATRAGAAAAIGRAGAACGCASTTRTAGWAAGATTPVAPVGPVGPVAPVAPADGEDPSSSVRTPFPAPAESASPAKKRAPKETVWTKRRVCLRGSAVCGESSVR